MSAISIFSNGNIASSNDNGVKSLLHYGLQVLFILCIITTRSMYHRAGLLSRSVHFFEGARAKFEDAYRSAPGCAEGLLLYSLVSLYLFFERRGRGLCIIICFIRVYPHYYSVTSFCKTLKILNYQRNYCIKRLNWSQIMLQLILPLAYCTSWLTGTLIEQ